MKYWTIVFLSCVINLVVAKSPHRPIVNDIKKSDTLVDMECLRLEYAYYTAHLEEEKFSILHQKLKYAIAAKNSSKIDFEIQRIQNLSPQLLFNNQFYYQTEMLLFDYGLYSSCLELMNTDTFKNWSLEQSFMKALCLNEEERWTELHQELRSAHQLFEKDTTKIFEELKSAVKADSSNNSVLLQYIFPGSGMVREGALQEGLISLALNGIFIAAPVLFIQQQLYSAAISYGLIPFSKFYFGGVRHTKYLLEQNRIKKAKALRQMNAQYLYNFYYQN